MELLRAAIVIGLLIIVLLVFYRVNKLPLTTIIPVWLFDIFVPGLIFNSIITNLKFIEKPKSPDPYIAYLTLQYFYLPLTILSLILLFNRARSWLKAGVVLLGTLILMAAEFLISLPGIFKYIHWNAGYSALLWMCIILISLAFYRFVESDFIRGTRYGDD